MQIRYAKKFYPSSGRPNRNGSSQGSADEAILVEGECSPLNLPVIPFLRRFWLHTPYSSGSKEREGMNQYTERQHLRI